ncbi:TPA: SocA family protein [Streptococcus suis]|nr:SocA family protein [Streptococcus suis]HEM4819147.1 SocA family protein [Streptococcus suis]HEM6204345.1 SocA family protein [Streptococcus suis]HEM6370884.1 SocA family protein [Streptococcus suis]
MGTIFDVALFIVDELGEMSTMKLQKLCYYAQAWSLAWDGVPLFEEDFQAWANGPVCKELYDIHKGQFSVIADDIAPHSSGYEFTSDEAESLEVVINDYGDKEAFWLSELTHQERPWRETRGNTPLGERSNAIISKELMQEYYSGLIGHG